MFIRNSESVRTGKTKKPKRYQYKNNWTTFIRRSSPSLVQSRSSIPFRTKWKTHIVFPLTVNAAHIQNSKSTEKQNSDAKHWNSEPKAIETNEIRSAVGLTSGASRRRQSGHLRDGQGRSEQPRVELPPRRLPD